jgi:hypothetical protein
MALDPAPSRLSLSGPSTAAAPISSPGTASNHATRTCVRALWWVALRTPSSFPILGAGSTAPVTATTRAIAPMAPNVCAAPTSAASPPTIGPMRAPRAVAPANAPSNSPRRSFGPPAKSHELPLVQKSAPATPCSSRVPTSRRNDSASPNDIVATPKITKPSTTPGLTPIRREQHHRSSSEYVPRRIRANDKAHLRLRKTEVADVAGKQWRNRVRRHDLQHHQCYEERHKPSRDSGRYLNAAQAIACCRHPIIPTDAIPWAGTQGRRVTEAHGGPSHPDGRAWGPELVSSFENFPASRAESSPTSRHAHTDLGDAR